MEERGHACDTQRKAKIGPVCVARPANCHQALGWDSQGIIFEKFVIKRIHKNKELFHVLWKFELFNDKDEKWKKFWSHKIFFTCSIPLLDSK